MAASPFERRLEDNGLEHSFVFMYYYGSVKKPPTAEKQHLPGPLQEKNVLRPPLRWWEECIENQETWYNVQDDFKLALLKYTFEYRFEHDADIVRLIQILFSPDPITTGKITEASKVNADEILPTIDVNQAKAIFTKLDIKNFSSFANMNELETLKLLIGICPDFSECTNKKMNYLHLAVAHGKSHMVKYLIEKGYNVNQPDYFGNTPFHCLARNVVEIHKLLLSNGANLLAKNQFGNIPTYSILQRWLEDKHMPERTEQCVRRMLDMEEKQKQGTIFQSGL